MRYLLALSIILILNKTAVAQFKDGFMFKTSICEGRNGGLLPIFGRCQGYYICNEGKAVVGSCDKGYLFNPLTLHCDDADNVICPYDNSDDDEEADMDTSESDQFESDEIEEPSTTTTTTRSPVNKKPPKPKPLHSPNDDYLNALCLGKRNGVTLPKARSCTEYYMCKSKMPQLRSCPGRQHFSPTQKMCMKASDAKCITAQEPDLQLEESKPMPAVTAGFCTDEMQDTLISHRDDCSKFLLCSNMMFLVMDCPVGLHFNAKVKRCDYPKIAECEAQKKPTKQKKLKLSNKKKLKASSF